jgi:DNA-binding transcriptional MerR regulator
MAEMSQQVEIPNRALFRAAEVCDLVKVQPYVLRSWEAEFKDLGITKSGSTARVYRREDIERVLRIKHLLLIEGLTLAGVRRKLEGEAEPPLEADMPAAPPGATLTPAARERIGAVKRGLRSLLDLLDAPIAAAGAPEAAAHADNGDFALASPQTESAPATTKASKRATTRERAVAGDEPGTSTSPRRKRSA